MNIRAFALTGFVAANVASGAEAPQARLNETHRTFLADYCFACHGKDGKVKGDFDLRTVKDGDDLKSQPELLAKIAGMILAPGARIAGALLGTGGYLAGQIESIADKSESSAAE